MRRTLCAILAAALLLMTAACGEREMTLEEYYDLGMRYLSEGKYEEAAIAFTAVLEIEPANKQALLGRAQAYVGLGGEENLALARADYEAVLALDSSSEEAWLGLLNLTADQGETEETRNLLEQAREELGDSEELDGIEDRLPEPPTAIADFEPVTLSDEESEALGDLLIQAGNFDCTAEDALARAHDLLSPPFCDIYRLFFPEEPAYGKGIDPLGAFSEWPNYFYRYPGDQVDWVLQNILNVKPVHMETPMFARNDPDMGTIGIWELYYYDGEYWAGPIPGTDSLAVTKVEMVSAVGNGEFSYITFQKVYHDYDWEWIDANAGQEYVYEDIPLIEFARQDYCALVKQKEIDGEKYWSLYYMGEEPLEDISRFAELE